MKLILFVIIIFIIYFLATQIKIVHIDTLPAPQKKELDDRTKLREMLLTTYIRCPEKENSTDKINTNKIQKTEINTNEHDIKNFNRKKFIGTIKFVLAICVF